MTGSARPLLQAVRDALETDSKLDARWLVGLRQPGWLAGLAGSLALQQALDVVLG